MKTNRAYKFVLPSFAFTLLLCASESLSQMPQVPAAAPEALPKEDYTWWYITLGVLLIGLAGVVVWWLKNKKAVKEAEAAAAAQKSAKSGKDQFGWDVSSLDADEEMEWLRKNQKLVDKRRKKAKPAASVQTTAEAVPAVQNMSDVAPTKPAGLPVFDIERLERARPFDQLPMSNDEGLMSAIEQAYEEYEEDSEIRDLAIRILAAFKTRNSVEALTQVALYDLSSTLRSKAVSVLSDFDHESVFEPILLACADPTREVRAAAARGLSRLSFDRADAWSRIAEGAEEGRMIHCARAAIEGGFVERIFERLVHSDERYTYEACTLLGLLLKAGETEPVFEMFAKRNDHDMRLALLHVIKISGSRQAMEGLYSILEQKDLSEELRDAADQAIEAIGFVTV
jgi:hypothetical protein